jgi:hypothetical protein
VTAVTGALLFVQIFFVICIIQIFFIADTLQKIVKYKKMIKKIKTIVIAASLVFSACQNNSKTNTSSDQDTSKVTTDNDTQKIAAIDTQKVKKDSVAVVKNSNVPYAVAEKYFVKNNVDKIEDPKIVTQEKFSELFGTATTMGKGGKPTKIDFDKEYVIALALPSTEFETSILPVSLVKNEKKEIVFTYRINKGKKQTFSIRPALAIIVDKTNDGKVVVKEQK